MTCEDHVLPPGVDAGDAITEEPGVEAGVFLAEVKKELMPEETDDDDEETEETVSTELIVADRFGMGIDGRFFIVAVISSVCLDFGGGRGGTASTGADSLESLSPLPTTHQRPEGLLSTLIASVLRGSMSPIPRARSRPHVNPADHREGMKMIDSQPMLRIAILKCFHVHLYLPPCMFFMTSLSSSKRALALSAM